jgi:hypothetical protein
MDATVFNSYLEALIHHLNLVHNGDDVVVVVVFSFSDDERLLTPLLSPVTCCSIFQKRRIPLHFTILPPLFMKAGESIVLQPFHSKKQDDKKERTGYQ